MLDIYFKYVNKFKLLYVNIHVDNSQFIASLYFTVGIFFF